VKDYYSILGVTKTATPDEIKQAYRRLAMQHHPDRGGDIDRFQAVEEAYRTLSDPAKRAEYDNPRQNVHVNFGGPGFNFDDIFSMFGVNQPRSPRTMAARTPNWTSKIAWTAKWNLGTCAPMRRSPPLTMHIPPQTPRLLLRLCWMLDECCEDEEA
jgi:DnaJ-class molecular chaperone